MLKHPSPGFTRRLGGMAFAVGLSIGGSYAVWAAQPQIPIPGASAKLIAVNMKWWINGADVMQLGGPAATRDFLVVSGKEFVRKVSFGAGQTYETRCFASLSNEDRESPVWKTAQALGRRVDGLILLECTLSNDDKIFSTPAILVGDGKAGTIEVATKDGGTRYKVEFNASTRPARTEVVH